MSRPVQDDDRIVVWFSCGAASAVALKVAVEAYGAHRVRAVNSPVAEEDEDNRRFLRDVEAWAGVGIETATNPEYPDNSAVSVWDDVRYMSDPKGAPCTRLLKREPRLAWELFNRADWHVLGFTAEEEGRHRDFVARQKLPVLPLLIERGLTKTACFQWLMAAGLSLPRVYGWGYPNANCIGCVKATSPTYWNLVRRTHPEVFAARSEQSRRIGARLVRVKGERIFLDELPPQAKGRALPRHMPDCGLFCEPPQVRP